MIQDIFPKKYHNEYRPSARPLADSPVFCFDGSDVFLKDKDGDLSLPLYSEIGGDVVYAFAIDDLEYFVLNDLPESIEGLSFFNLRQLRRSGRFDNGMMFAIFTAYHLSTWYKYTVRCGRCGTKLTHHDKARAMVCPDCKTEIYPRLNPAVIVAVISDKRILVTKYNRPNADFYALIAGFVEIGETLEDACRREVMEEAGLKIKNIRYYKSQPWGIAGDILCGFFCEVDGDDTIRMDEVELKVAQWVTPEETVLQPDDFSLTCEMMRMFKEGKIS
ncbi:MAG: NAD(+) diphosphatase [Clostridiales bacterium]|nr:NAD(+) diphosphatase [Clostridiales bacterium]